MRPRVWIPTLLIAFVVAVVAGYAYTNARHAGLDAPPGDGSTPTAADVWLAQDVAVPSGTEVAVVLETSLSTKTTHDGDAFVAKVETPVAVDGKVAIPRGAAVTGHVALVEQPGKASGRGRMQLAFDEVSYGGKTYALDARGPVYESPSGTKKDAALIGGGAIAGGVLGGVVGGTAGGAAKGALVGGATGTAASLLTRGPQLELPAGRTVRFTLDRDVSVRPAKGAA